MRPGRSGKPGRSPILDILEDFSTFNDTPGAETTARPIVLAGDLLSVTSANFMFLHGGGVAPAFVSQNEALARRFTPGSAQTCLANSVLGFPIGRDLSRFPSGLRPIKRYVWDTLIQRATALSATAELLVGLSDDAGELATVNQFIGLRSLATENAGRWTNKYMLTNGGAIVTGGDSGVAPDGTPQHFRFEYYDTVPGRLLIWINGVLKFTHTGANLPAYGNSNEPWNLLICSGGAAHVIGQVDHNFLNRYTVELM